MTAHRTATQILDGLLADGIITAYTEHPTCPHGDTEHDAQIRAFGACLCGQTPTTHVRAWTEVEHFDHENRAARYAD